MKIVIFLIAFAFFLSFFQPALAAKKRVRKVKATKVVSQSKGVSAQVRLRPDHLGLLINFSGFDNLASGRYELVYNSDGVNQGAGGSVILGDSSTKEILFATCSKGVCRFHENITDMKLSIVSVLKDGTTVLKPFRIKV